MQNQKSDTTYRLRTKQNLNDCWDLSSLYNSDEEWTKDLSRLNDLIPKLLNYRNKLSESHNNLREFLDLFVECSILAEKLGHYAFLRMSEDAGDPQRQSIQNSFDKIETDMNASLSWFEPELLAIPSYILIKYLDCPELLKYSIYLKKIIRRKPHTLDASAEKIMALQDDAYGAPKKIFSALIDVDADFGSIQIKENSIPLTHASFQFLQQHPDQSIRKSSYIQYYQYFENHQNTLGSLLSASIKQDTLKARARAYNSSLEQALFSHNIPVSLYTNLISEIRKGLPLLHRYYSVRKKIMKTDQLNIWDVKAGLSNEVSHKMLWKDASNLVLESLQVLGDDYVSKLRAGLQNRWVDKYENKGKRSGAFSAGSYSSNPYILMNYRDDSMRDVFTLAHEVGHSMHSLYSVANNPFQHYHYSIFEAEIASTVNEQILFKHWYNKAINSSEKAYLVNKQIDDIIATLFRQTMFAEFELLCHREMEQNSGLTTSAMRKLYRSLLQDYFGVNVVLHDLSDLEAFRIPHFYRAFYVYQYATGISAAIALSQDLIHGNGDAISRYFKFLSSGGSRFPLESIALTGIDMRQPEPIQRALHYFSCLLDQLEHFCT